jgi:hypothetical protein
MYTYDTRRVHLKGSDDDTLRTDEATQQIPRAASQSFGFSEYGRGPKA